MSVTGSEYDNHLCRTGESLAFSSKITAIFSKSKGVSQLEPHDPAIERMEIKSINTVQCSSVHSCWEDLID